MAPPKQKHATVWSLCNTCNCYILTKSTDEHNSECPPSVDKWRNSFILNEVLFTSLNLKSKDDIVGVNSQNVDNFVFLSQSVIQLCNLKIGDPVLITISDEKVPIVRTVWPTAEKTITSVLLTSNCINYALNNLELNRLVRVEAIPEEKVLNANRLVLCLKSTNSKLELNSDISKRIQRSYVNKIVCVENQLFILYYGKMLIFTVKTIEGNETDLSMVTEKLSDLSFVDDKIKLFKITENTKITFTVTNAPKTKIKESNFRLGGLEDVKNKIKRFADTFFACTSETTVVKSVLLYGSPGTGKTSLARNVAKEIYDSHQAKFFTIQSSDLSSQYSGDAEDHIKMVFKQAEEAEKCVVLVDDIDILCPSRISRPSEQEKRITAGVVEILENLNSSSVFIIATSNRPDSIDASLRRFGRIDTEIEVPVPNEPARKEIFENITKYNRNTALSSSELNELASLTPGYVGSDILLAYATARTLSETPFHVTIQDLKMALKKVKPSAMREVQIESTNVSWSDIGGQDTLKLKLKQAIEWPLTHPESFYRMGVRPPRGILMYGPPGCSKTMIAKALASETKLNFLSIKGPELFNKYVGESEKAVRDLFKRARQAAPSIVFFDEIDAISGERASSSAGAANVQERVLAQLLTELDGVTALGAVTVVAATNRPDRIDKALLRPGRLDRIIYVPLPDTTTRSAIIRIKTSKMPVVELNLDYLVQETEGYSGAEVEAVCNEAAMKALEEDISASEIRMEHFEYALKLVRPRISKSLLNIYENYSKNS